MIRSWKTFGLTLVAVLVVAALVSGGSARPTPVFADHDERITIDVVGGGIANAQFTVTGDCAPGFVSLDDNDTPVELNCDADDGVAQITAATAPTGTELSTIVCTVDDDGATAGEQSTLTEDPGDGQVDIDMADNEHWTCVFTFVAADTTPTPTGTPATATPTVTGTVTVGTLTVSAAPSTLSCSGSAFITVVARNAGGQVVAAGTVTLSTNIGTITPTSAVDSGAGVLAVLTAPANQGGTATVTASAGGATGSTQVTINCAQATAVPPTAVPQAPIVPPSTGDAGLADGGQWRTLVGITLLGMAIAGAVGMARSRLRA